MRYITNICLKGLGAALPIALSLYLIFWLGSLLERLLRPAIVLAVSPAHYVVGMGLISGLVLIFLFGLVIEAWVVRRVLQLAEALITRIPLIKTIYGGLRDFIDYFSKMEKSREMRKVVFVSIAGTRVIGFLTGEAGQKLSREGAPELVSVYLPMSYQIGGFTVYVPREIVEPIDMSVEEAMRLALTAGVSGSTVAPVAPSPPAEGAVEEEARGLSCPTGQPFSE